MAKIKTICPACQSGYMVDEKHIGKKTHCLKCKTKFRVANGIGIKIGQPPQGKSEESAYEVTESIDRSVKSEDPITQQGQSELKLNQSIEATIKKDTIHEIVQTIPVLTEKEAESIKASEIHCLLQDSILQLSR